MMKRQLIVVVGLFSFGYIQTTQIKNDERNGMSEAQKKTLYYVTSNPSKVSRCAQFIPPSAGLELKQVDVDLYEEQTEDQQAIALAKARQAWSVVKKPLLVDEIGVYFNKYHNFPGAFTKYVYKGIGLEGCYKLMNDGDQMSKQMIAVFMWGPESYKIFTIVVPGFFKKTGLQPTDKNAPFDAVFVPEGQQQTYDEIAQADFELFNRTYIRALCIRQVVDFIAKSDVL